MSALAQIQDAPVIESNTIGSTAMMFGAGNFDRAMKVADAMAGAVVSVPAHFRNKPGDCLAVVMQAAQWNMNPFAVAQKTHLSQSGALGYEAQLISAVIVSCGAITGQPEFRFLGDWNRVLGKVEERKSDKGGKYYVPTYTKADEEGLGVVCTAYLRGESEPREITVMMSQCYPRFSTQWATDPQQQITYVAVRKFARRYAPGAILGVYTPDELEDQSPRDMGTIDRSTGEVKTSEPKVLPAYTAEQMDANVDGWREAILAGKTTPERLIAMVSSKYKLSEDQVKIIKDLTVVDADFVNEMEEAAQ